MTQPEDVQYFQFDSEGNMFIYPPGCGINGTPKLFKPGDELVFSGVNFQSKSLSSQVLEVTQDSSDVAQVCSQRSFNKPLGDKEMEVLSHKDFSKETKKKMKWVLKMYDD